MEKLRCFVLFRFFPLKQFCNSVISKERGFIAFAMRRLILECLLGRLQQDSLLFPFFADVAFLIPHQAKVWELFTSSFLSQAFNCCFSKLLRGENTLVLYRLKGYKFIPVTYTGLKCRVKSHLYCKTVEDWRLFLHGCSSGKCILPQL